MLMMMVMIVVNVNVMYTVQVEQHQPVLALGGGKSRLCLSCLSWGSPPLLGTSRLRLHRALGHPPCLRLQVRPRRSAVQPASMGCPPPAPALLALSSPLLLHLRLPPSQDQTRGSLHARALLW